MESRVGKLEEQAIRRKERLKALRKRQQEGAGETQPTTSAEENQSLPKPVFRSYQPLDDSLKEHQLPKVKLVEVTDQVRDQLDAAKPEPLVEEVDLMNLAPCKPDWDLKRDIAKKLEKLERRTQRAIAEIIRERILTEKDLAAVATWVATENQIVGSDGKASTSVIGPKLPAVNADSSSSAVNTARTAHTGFDDDSD